MDDGPPLRCPACRHEIAYDDSVRTVAGRRYHVACVDAHHTDPGRAGTAVRVVAGFVERFARALRF